MVVLAALVEGQALRTDDLVDEEAALTLHVIDGELLLSLVLGLLANAARVPVLLALQVVQRRGPRRSLSVEDLAGPSVERDLHAITSLVAATLGPFEPVAHNFAFLDKLAPLVEAPGHQEGAGSCGSTAEGPISTGTLCVAEREQSTHDLLSLAKVCLLGVLHQLL